MPRYFVLHDGGRSGPFSPEELGQLAATGALGLEDRLEEEATGAATTLRAVVESTPAREPDPATIPAPAKTAPPGATAPGIPRPAALIWTALLGLLSLYLLIRRPPWFVLDWVNLPMHEAGHIVFGFFGEFIQFLGGTLMQLAIPALVAVCFWRERKLAGAQFGLFWLGESCLNISFYVADARALQLELIGGEHDWHYLLSHVGLLNQDQLIAAVFVVFAGLAFAAAVLWPFLVRFGETPDPAAPGVGE